MRRERGERKGKEKDGEKWVQERCGNVRQGRDWKCVGTRKEENKERRGERK